MSNYHDELKSLESALVKAKGAQPARSGGFKLYSKDELKLVCRCTKFIDDYRHELTFDAIDTMASLLSPDDFIAVVIDSGLGIASASNESGIDGLISEVMQ